MNHRIIPAAASPSFRSPFKETALQLSSRLDKYVIPETSEPGQMLPVVRYKYAEVRPEFLKWDDAIRDERGNPGFVDGYNKDFAYRCAVAVQKIVYPLGRAGEGLGTGCLEATKPSIIWLAARVFPSANGMETVSVITAPTQEGNAALSNHEPVVIDPEYLPAWFDVTVDAHLIQRSRSALKGTSPLFMPA